MKIKIGVLLIYEGAYKSLGDDAKHGVNLAFNKLYEALAEKDIELEFIYEGTHATGVSAIQSANKLLNEHKVDLILGPLSGDEGKAIRDLAKETPDRMFVNGSAGSQQIYNLAPNFFSFSPNGVQFIVGLGQFCADNGYKRVVTISEAYSYPFAQIGGFSLEFCKAGGTIVDMQWCGLGTSDYTEYINKMPDDIDAVCSFLGGTDAIQFIKQYRELKGDIPIVAGTLFADSSTLNFVNEYADLLDGVYSASPVCDVQDNANWQQFIQNYKDSFRDDAYYSPSIVAYAYYLNAMGLLNALIAVGGDLSNGQSKLKDALLNTSFESPTGAIKLDRNHGAIIDNFVTQIAVNEDGQLHTKFVKRIEQVDSTLGYSNDDWLGFGEFNIRNMPCDGFRSKSLSLEDILRQRRKK